MSKCIDHLSYLGERCPDCGLDVDDYGNTEAQPFDYCSYPNCGCDGARLCMAGEASERAMDQNIEGMWGNNPTNEQRAARLKLFSSVHEDLKGAQNE